MKKIPRYKRGLSKAGIGGIRVEVSQLESHSKDQMNVPECYHDKELTCSACKIKFWFTVQRQKELFETLKVNINAVPRLCGVCKEKLHTIRIEIKSMLKLIPLVGETGHIEIETISRLLKLYALLKLYVNKIDTSRVSRLKKLLKTKSITTDTKIA